MIGLKLRLKIVYPSLHEYNLQKSTPVAQRIRARRCGRRGRRFESFQGCQGGVLGVVYQPGFENLGGRKTHAGSNPAASAYAPVVQLDRTSDSGSEGRRSESSQACKI